MTQPIHPMLERPDGLIGIAKEIEDYVLEPITLADQAGKE